MKKFSELLNTLYFTYGHLDKMAILEHYFSTTPDPERGYALSIMAGTLDFPTFKRSLIKELVQENEDPHLFELSYDYVGDMSDTIALIWPEPKIYKPLPLLSELIKTFNELDKDKIKPYLHELLNKSTAIERWALLKLGTGSLRIGISARFLKKVLARFGGVSVDEVEQVWHSIKPPYLELFAWLEKKAGPPDCTENLYFHPVMLSHPLQDKELALLDLNAYAFEKKYDGIRVQVVSTAKGVAIYTRTGDLINQSFPDLANLFNSKAVLDGELIIKKEASIGSFNELQQRLNRKNPSKKLLSDSPSGLIVYDILSVDNNDLRSLSFLERRKQLELWLQQHPSSQIILSDLLKLKTNQSLLELKNEILAEKHPAVEGLMIKQISSPYLAGRPKGYWYKWKREPLLVDAVLMYAQRGHGKRSSYYSDYTFGLWQDGLLLPIGKAYSGFTDEELLKLDRWIRHHTVARFGPVREVEKELVLEIAFDAVNLSKRHKSGVALRFPRVNRLRWDKPANEADELKNLIAFIQTAKY